MRKTWALVMAAAMAAASLTACSSSKPAETAAPETEAEAAETEETEAEAEATGDQQEILVAAAASLQYVMEDKIQPAFEKENPDIKLSFTFDSSGRGRGCRRILLRSDEADERAGGRGTG
jgi:molybdate transport system substrate-binding protein